MRRRVRWLVVIVVVLLAAGATVAVLTVQPGLSDARDRVDARWIPLRRGLTARYMALAGVDQALKDAGAGDREVTKELDGALARWSKLALRGDRHSDPAAESTAANALEALARRARADVTASARLAGSDALRNAIGAFDLAVVARPGVDAYNRAVRSYQDEREGTLNHLVAGALGYDARPRLLLGG